MASEFQQGAVRGFVHRPERPAAGSLVITHGAGSNCGAPVLVAFAEAFCNFGFLVLRCDLPFRQRRASGPPLPAWAKDDQEGLKQAVMAVREMAAGPGTRRPVILGGHSYGGRQATLLAAAEPDIADGLLLLSYPLHPPKRPDQLRTAHWPRLRTPAFFVHGTRDPFGSAAEIESALPLIPGPAKIVFLERTGHDLGGGRIDIEEKVIGPLNDFLTTEILPSLA